MEIFFSFAQNLEVYGCTTGQALVRHFSLTLLRVTSNALRTAVCDQVFTGQGGSGVLLLDRCVLDLSEIVLEISHGFTLFREAEKPQSHVG